MTERGERHREREKKERERVIRNNILLINEKETKRKIQQRNKVKV